MQSNPLSQGHYSQLPFKAVDFVIITALAEEREAVLRKLPGYQQLAPVKDNIHTYFQADLPVTFPDDTNGTYRVIVMCLFKLGRVEAGVATADVIRQWHPRYVLLVGIAGGIAAKNVQIGDILIAEKVVDYELQKITPENTEYRWNVKEADQRLLKACYDFKSDWRKDIKIKRPVHGSSTCHFGDIASGDKVIASSDTLARLMNGWPKLLGVEMEAAGVAAAVSQTTENTRFFMVRAVSDFSDENKGSGDIRKWRLYVCDAAASFTIALLRSGPIPVSISGLTNKKREEKQENFIVQNLNQSLDFQIEFRVETPINEQEVQDEDCPLSASGTYSSEKPFHAWVLLDDIHGNFYLQHPPIKFYPSRNCWKSTENIKPADSKIENIHFVYVDEPGHSQFSEMARHDRWGAFTELPPNSKILCTISIKRITK